MGFYRLRVSVSGAFFGGFSARRAWLAVGMCKRLVIEGSTVLRRRLDEHVGAFRVWVLLWFIGFFFRVSLFWLHCYMALH